ncbi:MAG: hypothetical protein ACI9IV_002607, partial [Paracoccaceae bacterium]
AAPTGSPHAQHSGHAGACAKMAGAPPDPNCNIQGNIVEKMTVLLKHLFNGR